MPKPIAKPHLVPAVGYLRRSTDKQEASIGEQTEAVAKYASERGYAILRWYTDDAVSGDNTRSRHDFLRMISDATERGDFKAILCWDRARFGRFDSIEYGYFTFTLRRAGIHLATVLDGVTDWNDSSGRIIATVSQEGKHQQLLDHSANVTRGHLGAANNGGWLGSPPYAYRIEGPRKAKKLVLEDPAKTRVVQRIFNEFVVEGRSMKNIADRLNAEGYLSPGGRVNGWRFDTVRTILENPAYTGDYAGCRWSYGKYNRIRGGMVGKSTGRTRNAESEWIIRRDNHESIIDRTIFAKSQSLLVMGKTGRSPHTPETNPYFLSCMLRCGRCGGTLHGINNGTFRYYECSNAKHNGLDTCEGTTVREDRVLHDIANYLENWLGLEGEALGTAAYYGQLTENDIPNFPKAFEEVKKIVSPPGRPKEDRKRLEAQAEQLRVKIGKARANLVLLDADNIPAAQERIRGFDTELTNLETELKNGKPMAQRDVNAQVLGVVHNLYSLAYCCRALARQENGNWKTVGSLEAIAPQLVRRFLSRANHIVCHTTREGRGTRTRHVFQRGEITFSVGPVTGNENPHTPVKSRKCCR